MRIYRFSKDGADEALVLARSEKDARERLLLRRTDVSRRDWVLRGSLPYGRLAVEHRDIGTAGLASLAARGMRLEAAS